MICDLSYHLTFFPLKLSKLFSKPHAYNLHTPGFEYKDDCLGYRHTHFLWNFDCDDFLLCKTVALGTKSFSRILQPEALYRTNISLRYVCIRLPPDSGGFSLMWLCFLSIFVQSNKFLVNFHSLEEDLV